MKLRQVLLFLGVWSILMTTIAVMGQTRRTREETYIQDTVNTEETQLLSILIKVCDPDGDNVMIEAEGLPSGATLSATTLLAAELIPDVSNPANCDNPLQCQECGEPNSVWFGAELSWTPAYDQAGQYTIYVHAMDDRGGEDWVAYVINVINKNRSPVL